MQSAQQPSPEAALPSSHSSSGSLRPSPHGEAQPEVPTQTGSARQSALQPSPPKTLPSSHDSSPSRTLSPQTVGWQGGPGVGQAEPGSTRHASLQPSPAHVVAVVASLAAHHHAVAADRDAARAHRRADPAGLELASPAMQPSPDVRLRSSHVSASADQAVPAEDRPAAGLARETVQIQSVSVLQSGEQPSPPFVFPSSQVSAGRSTLPFPHGGRGQLRPVAGSQAGPRSKAGRSAGITSKRTSAALSGVVEADASRRRGRVNIRRRTRRRQRTSPPRPPPS